jgi:N-acetylmuramic acid 6-phosphate etherase
MADQSKWRQLPTEAVNAATRDIDTLATREVIDLMVADNARVLEAVRAEADQIARVADMLAGTLRQGGRLILVGAGTSGRLGVLEAAEMPPTFGISPRTVRALMAGGTSAVSRAKEGVEDDEREGGRALGRLKPSRKDIVIGVSASGVTPFVRGALIRARRAGSAAVGITCVPNSEMREFADPVIALPVGPEIIAGSTRLKAGTATKVVLNMLTTTAMIQVGKTYGNLMVDVQSNSDKLRDRGRRIVSTVTGVDYAKADAVLRRAGWNVKAAIVMEKTGLSRVKALQRLQEARDSVRVAIGEG